MRSSWGLKGGEEGWKCKKTGLYDKEKESKSKGEVCFDREGKSYEWWFLSNTRIGNQIKAIGCVFNSLYRSVFCILLCDDYDNHYLCFAIVILIVLVLVRVCVGAAAAAAAAAAGCGRMESKIM